MIEKIKNYLLKVKKIKFNSFNLLKNNKKNKLKEYKLLRKNKKKINKHNKKRNKYNFQLNLNLYSKNFKKIIFISSLIIILIVSFILKWPFLRLENINIIKLDENVNVPLIEKNLNWLKWKVLFNIRNEDIENIIINSEQNIKDINITRIFPKTIKLKISSYETIFKTSLKWNNYLITKNWVFIPTRNENKNIDSIEIKGLDLQNYPNYKKILSSENIEKILYIKNKIKDNIINIKIEKTIYYKTQKEVHFIINNETRLIFDLVWDLDKKLEQLFVFNKEKINIIKPWIIYIDNRIISKILYCDQEELDNCVKNINYIYDEKIKTSDYKTKKED